MTNWPVHAAIDGPIVMIGFGSIGKGTLPLIERHFSYDKTRIVVIDPDDSDREILDVRGVRFIHQAVTRENYRDLLVPLLTAGGGRGFCVNLSVDTSSVAIMELAREIGAFYIDTVIEPWPGFYFDRQPRIGGTHQLRAARIPACGAAAQSRRHHRGVVLRRQSRHGVVVRQAGAPRHRPRPRREDGRAEHPGAMGPARHDARRQGHPHRRARHPAGAQSQAAGRVRQHLVGGGLPVRGHAAGRTRLGHPRDLDAGQCPHPRQGLRGRDLHPAARRQHAGAVLDADAAGAIRLPRHPQRVDLDRGLFHRARRRPEARGRRSTGRPATTPIIPATTRCCRCTRCSAAPG